ncbi:TIGR03885 family FMN-dependent LLM class oxidoreductase [Pedobacter agri]|uniref:TIGR03885 family FMN-dependent LLM class oxidoreductase n=1 Tax=Pedobacter agri TaxID=454586 RepID=UPI002781C3DB|nr:TIGR03885 family FMN-dependent LLM class oxidoreductase [Pedobacter agri]MDQ1142763.1 coenzyme F420-dependent glucose-6-phosphate dehydrogenase [Pedobacter agri]
MTIAYHASHEQFSPSLLLKYAVAAEKAGFTAISSSDHFHPWSERQGQSGFSFSWLGAALQATRLPFSMVCAPGQRYHPAIVAQAIATLAEMFPERFLVALGSGEALNETITGEKWPEKSIRNERLLECHAIISQLLSGEKVSHKGLVSVENAKLYTLPAEKPLLLCAAVSAETARWAGSWADGLLTTHRSPEELKKLISGFRENGGKGKPVHLKVQLSYDRNESKAEKGAFDQWRSNIFRGSVLGELPTVAHFDAASEFVQPSQMHKHVRISSDLDQHVEWLKADIALGVDRLILHNVNRNQTNFIDDFGKEVLPFLIP